VLAVIDRSSYFRGDCGIINFKTRGNCEQSKSVKSSQFGFFGESESNTRMVTGCTTDKPVPWYAVILIKENHRSNIGLVKRCGGTYINKFWVLTAGHCICNNMMKCSTIETGVLAPKYNFSAALFVMLPGKLSVPTTSEKHFQVVEIVMHPKYKYNHAYDFALLRLDYPLADNLYGIGYNHQFSDTLRPICIPHPETIPDDIEKIATTMGYGNVRGSCLTNEKGPEPFAPCAEKWMSGKMEKVLRPKTGGTRCSSGRTSPKQADICEKIDQHMRALSKSKASDLSESDKNFIDTIGSRPDEIIVVPSQELSKTTGLNKTHCFLSRPKYGWCGVCDTTIPKGSPGYCVDAPVKPSAEKGWGHCSEPCNKVDNAGYKLGFAELTTLHPVVCKGLLDSNATSNMLTDKREMNFDENVEFCAAYVRELKPPVIAYTITEDGKHEFVLTHDFVSPEIKSIRLEKSILKDHDMLLGGVDACNGDSGGPLWLKTNDTYVNGNPQERAYLIGVIARGKDCAVRNLPGIYGRVKTVLEWIIENTNKTQIYKKTTKPGAIFTIEGILEPAKIGKSREISPFWENELPKKKKNGKEGKKGRKKKKRRKKRRNRKKAAESKKNKKKTKRKRKKKRGRKRQRKKN